MDRRSRRGTSGSELDAAAASGSQSNKFFGQAMRQLLLLLALAAAALTTVLAEPIPRPRAPPAAGQSQRHLKRPGRNVQARQPIYYDYDYADYQEYDYEDKNDKKSTTTAAPVRFEVTQRSRTLQPESEHQTPPPPPTPALTSLTSYNAFQTDDLPKEEQIQSWIKDSGLGDKIPKEFQNVSLPNLEQGVKMLEDKCIKNGGSEAWDTAKEGQDEFTECVNSLFNFTGIQEELEKAKPTGDMDQVFKKYCNKVPEFDVCLSSLFDKVSGCLEPTEREHQLVFKNLTDQIINFVCFKEGDRIALFIAEGGPECIESQQEGLTRCVNESFGSYVPKEWTDPNNQKVPSVEDIPLLILDLKHCKSLNELQQCAVKSLEGCKQPTPANIMESMFKFIKKVTVCGNLLREDDIQSGRLNANSSNQNTILFLTSIISLLLTMFLR